MSNQPHKPEEND